MGLRGVTDSDGQLVIAGEPDSGFQSRGANRREKGWADIARSRHGCQYLMSECNQFRAVTVVAVSVGKKASDAYCRWPISVATLGVTDHP